MNIFFDSSLLGLKEYKNNYLAIKKAIEKTENEIVAVPVLQHTTEDVIKETAKEAGDYYAKMVKWIKQADVCVFEVSYPSTSIGHEIAVALNLSKPVIALSTKQAPKNLILESMSDDKLQVIEYSLENVDKIVDDAIEYALEQADTRFNFFISPQIGAYLDKISKQKRIPRAVYLRRLIEEDMEKNTEFEG